MNNKSVKIGDIFVISWGYEQTNADFYRVKAKRGKTQLIVQGVDLEIDKVDCISSMAGNYKYNKAHFMLKDNDVFINDNAKGKIVKLDQFYTDRPCFRINGHIATPYNNETVYESFYA